MRLRWLVVGIGLGASAGCPAADDGTQPSSGTDTGTGVDTSTTGTDGATSTDGPSPGSCADQTTKEACMAHVGTNDIGEPAADCSWEPTYAVTLEAGTCAFEEAGGACMGIAFDDTCGIEGDICENGRSVGYAIDPDGTVRIASVFFASTCGFPDGLQPCHDVSGTGGSGGDTTSGSGSGGGTAGGDEEPPECACGCEL